MATVQTGKASEFITFTRASNATVTDSDGKIKWAPHNLLLASEQFDSASWTKTSTTPTANAVAAPNGTTTADTLTASGANGTTLQSYTSLGVSYTFGIWLKRKTGTGNIQIAADSGTYTTVTITSDWALYTVTQTPAAGTISAGIRIVTSADAVEAWGAHLYRSDLGGMKANTSAYPMYNPTTPKNLIGFSEDWSNAAWTKTGILAFGSGSVSNAIVAPNGLLTADLIIPDTSTGFHFTKPVAAVTAPANTTYTYSAYVKPAGYTKFALRETVATGVYAGFLLSGAGSVIDKSASATATITALSDGWYRLSMTVAVAPTSIGLGLYPLAPSYTSGVVEVSWTPNGTDGFYLWGAQLSDSASLDAYVPNYGAAPTAAAYYGPRLDFDGSTLAAKGLLVEEQRVNRIRYSRTLETTGSYWTSVASGTANTVTIDNAPGPDGLSTSASLITYNTAVTGAGTYSLWRQGLTTTANGTWTFTVWLKAGTTSSVYLRFGDNAGNRANTLCTLTSSWQRFTVTGTTTASITSIACDIGADGNAGGQTLTAGTVYAYGAQLEFGGFATSYIPNGDAIAGATRDADVASVSTQAFPYNQPEGTVVVNVVPTLTIADNTRALWFSNASDRVVDIYISTGNWAYFNGSTFVTAGTPAASVGTQAKYAAAYKSGSYAGVLNGGAAGTAASSLVYTATNMYLGCASSGTLQLNGHIRQITYLPRRISNAELITRTS
jgi:hypothetical protein